jgi:hypothetical protein
LDEPYNGSIVASAGYVMVVAVAKSTIGVGTWMRKSRATEV